jgi:hypothetical protein
LATHNSMEDEGWLLHPLTPPLAKGAWVGYPINSRGGWLPSKVIEAVGRWVAPSINKAR